jgi:hypothetical protein
MSRFTNPHWSIYDQNLRCYRRGDEARKLRAAIASNRSIGRKRLMLWNRSVIAQWAGVI